MKRRHTYQLIVLCILLLMYVCNGCWKPGKEAAVASAKMEMWDTEQQPTEKPENGYEPAVSEEPSISYEPELPIDIVDVTEEPDSDDEEDEESLGKQLGKVQGVKATRYSTHEIKISWKKQKKAKFYRVYYSWKKNGKYRLAGITKKQHYLVRKLKNHKEYYFYVKACKKRKATIADSSPSRKISIRTKTYQRKTIFAGDSICQGIAGWTIPSLHIGGRKKVVAYKGLNTVTFHTKRIFGGRTGLQKLIAEKPYRVYMMLGINEIHYRRWREMIREYEAMVRAIKSSSPKTDIVLCSVSPVTARERAHRKGFHQIPIFNRHLKKMAKRNGVKYLNYTAFLKDSRGYLKSGYAQRDGYHWKPPAYRRFAKVIQKYDLSQDR